MQEMSVSNVVIFVFQKEGNKIYKKTKQVSKTIFTIQKSLFK